MANFNWLPPELLLYVLSLSGISAIRFSAVCAAWRNVALASRLLWTDIEVQDERADVTLERARAFATRAGGLPLNITRRATLSEEKYLIPKIKEPSLEVSRFVIAAFPHCKSFSYLDIQGFLSWGLASEEEIDRISTRHNKAFITTILTMRANLLESISFSVFRDRGFTIYISDFTRGLPHLATNFPALRSVYLCRLCLPLRQIGIPWHRLEKFSLEGLCGCKLPRSRHLPCATRCYDLLLPTVTAMVRSCGISGSLRVLSIKGSVTGYGFDKNEPDSISIEDVLLPTLESLSLRKIDLRWPTHEFRPGGSEVYLPRLASLSIGLCDDYTEEYTEGSGDNPTSATFLRLLARIPNLVVLTIGRWGLAPAEPRPTHLVVTLQHVRTLKLDRVQVDRLADIYAGLNLPALEDLTLRDIIESQDAEGHKTIPGSRWPMRHFSLRMDTIFAWWFAPIFADMPTVETIHLEGTKWDKVPWAPDWVIKLFSDPAVAPCAREVRCVMCQHVYEDGVKRVVRKESPRPGLVISFEACFICIKYHSDFEDVWDTSQHPSPECTEADVDSDEYELDSDDSDVGDDAMAMMTCFSVDVPPWGLWSQGGIMIPESAADRPRSWF